MLYIQQYIYYITNKKIKEENEKISTYFYY